MSTEKEKKNEINKHKISQIIITVLPFVALAVLFVVFVAVVTMPLVVLESPLTRTPSLFTVALTGCMVSSRIF